MESDLIFTIVITRVTGGISFFHDRAITNRINVKLNQNFPADYLAIRAQHVALLPQ